LLYASSGSEPERSGEALTPDELNDLIILVNTLNGTVSGDTSLQKNLGAHIGPEATYALKKPVLESLKIIYERLKGEGISEPEKQMIAFKLQERAEQCTPGFHNGVNGIIDGFSLAQDVTALMQRVRQSMVSSMANRLTNEVHTNNRCFVVAEKEGYGVHALNRDDMYRGDLSDAAISQALETTFSEKMRLFFVLNALEEEFRGQLSITGYEGPKEAGYQADELEAIDDYLKMFYRDCPEVIALNKAEAMQEQVREKGKEREQEIHEAITVFSKQHPVAFEGFDKQTKAKEIALREFGKARQNMLPPFKKWAEQAIKKLTPEEKSAFDKLIDTAVLSKEIQAINLELERAHGTFKAFFYLQNKEGAVNEINWSNLKSLFWDALKRQPDVDVPPDEVKHLDILLNPSTSEMEGAKEAIAFLSHPENKQDIESLLKTLNLPDALVEIILIELWDRDKTKGIELARRLLFFAITQHSEIYVALCKAFDVPAKDFFISELAKNGMLLRYAPDELRDDDEVSRAAVANNPGALRYTSKAFTLATVAQNGMALEDASAELKGDRDVVLAAVAQNGWALQFASDGLKGDDEVSRAAVANNAGALRYTSKAFTLATVAQNGQALVFASDGLKGDRDVVLAAVAQNGGALRCASAELKADREFILAVVAQDGWALWYASAGLKGDRDVVLAAVAQNGGGTSVCLRCT
jgi:hypothetical protein